MVRRMRLLSFFYEIYSRNLSWAFGVVNARRRRTIKPSYFFECVCDFSYKNGSVTRERIRNQVAEGDWELFNQLLDSTPRGNFGNIGKTTVAAAAAVCQSLTITLTSY